MLPESLAAHVDGTFFGIGNLFVDISLISINYSSRGDLKTSILIAPGVLNARHDGQQTPADYLEKHIYHFPGYPTRFGGDEAWQPAAY